MTCVVGVQRDGRVVIAGDSRGTAGLNVTDRADEKVFRVWAGSTPVIIGCTTSYRMIQVLRYRLQLPPIDTWDLRRWMSVQFVDAARKAFGEAGWLRKETDGAERGGSFLVGIRDQLFAVEGDHQVGVPRCGFDAVGCGFAYALGAMHATASTNPERIALTGLEAAARFSAGVAPPFVLMNTEETA